MLIWASNAFGKSFGSDAGPTTLWNGGRVPLSPATDKPIEVTTVETGTQAAIPNFKAYRPYASWDDMLQNEYMLWTGHNKKGEDITNGLHPRDDEFTFWRYNLAVKDYPTSYIDNTTWLDESLNPDAVVPITFTSWSWPDSWEQGKYNSYRAARLDARQRAMLDFAMKVCQRSHEIDDGDFAALHAHGFDNEDVWDIAAITAFFGLSNRMASFSNMMPNPEFYLMGRVPREKKPG